MSAWALGCAWAALVVAAAWASRPAPRRVRALAPPGPLPARRPRPSPLRVIGRVIRSRLGRRDDPAADARLGRAVLTAVLVLPVVPLLAPAAGAATWAFGAWRGRQRRRAEADLVRRGLPEVVDLFVVGIGAGLNVPLALRSIGPLCPTPFADALRSTVTQTEMGMRTADALEALPQRLGEPVRPLSSALIASERYGVPLTASLERLADEVRRDRRRHAEAAARRVPVKLLFPLVFCSLPALALLSVAPLIAGALRALRT
jgi:tight adherence protein C